MSKLIWKRSYWKINILFKNNKYFQQLNLIQGPEGAEFNVTWKPKIIDPERFVQIQVDFIARKAYLQQYFDISHWYFFKPRFF